MKSQSDANDDANLNPELFGKNSKPVSTFLDRSHCGSCSKDLRKEDQKICARCKCIAYCSKQCQKKDWKRHKPTCGPFDKMDLKIKENVKKKASNDSANIVRPDVVRGYAKLLAVVNPAGLSPPELPGWPLRKIWPVSQKKLTWYHLSRYFYRYPGYEFMELGSEPEWKSKLPNCSKIREWNDLAGSDEAFEWEYPDDPLLYIDRIKPFANADAIPMALDALQNLYMLAACNWKKDTKLSAPTEQHKEYFKKAVELMQRLVKTEELGCEYPLGSLLMTGNDDFSFPRDEAAAMGLLKVCTQRGGDEGRAARILSQHLNQEMTRSPGANQMDLYEKSLRYARLAAEQGQLPVACQALATAVIGLYQSGVGEASWALEWKKLGDQGEKAFPSSELRDWKTVIKFSKRLSRPVDQVSWDLFGLGEAEYF